MNIFGFGKSGDKTYGVASDKPDWWPDNMGFALFKGPNFATIKEANQILEALFESNNLDIHEHFSASALTMDMAGKRTTSTNKKKLQKKEELRLMMTPRKRTMIIIKMVKFVMMMQLC